MSELNSLEMPFTSKYVVKHYLEIGCKIMIYMQELLMEKNSIC